VLHEAGLVYALPASRFEEAACWTSSRRQNITVEIDQAGNRFIEGLLGPLLTVSAGLLELGDRPGLGIEVDADFVQGHRVESPFQIPEGNHCDLIFGPPSVLRSLGAYVGPAAS
jgi:hypothetical protein